MTNLKQRKDTADKPQPIKVFPRIRPMSTQEREAKAHGILDVCDNTVSVKHMSSTKRYTFDHVFDRLTSQQDIYTTVVSPMILEVLNGFSCTVFAYGQTGTGKTFTMAGGSPEVKCWREDKEAGVIPRALAQLFELLRGRENNVRISYIELYNEEIIDLLSVDDCAPRIRLFDDQKQKGSVLIQGAEEQTVRDKNEVYGWLERGMVRRQTAATLMNAHSSRSHTVFIITVHTREVSPEGEELVKVGKLYLVDLAGSENIMKSGATEKRARETGMINQSLLTLGRVIKALVGNNTHVPYRESKLTRILQDSLGGRSKTSLIITLSPSSTNLEETLNTLEYGARARNITNRPEVNLRMSKTALITSYVEEIDKLKKDLAACRHKDGIFINPDNYEQMMAEKRERSDELVQRLREVKEFQERIDRLETNRKELEINFAVSESSLNSTQTRLSHCRNALLKVKKKNKIRDFYIKQVFDIEERYVNSQDELKKFADRLYNTECFMHRKVERMYQAFEKNSELGMEVLINSRDTKSDLISKVEEYSTKISDQCIDLQRSIIENRKASEENLSIFVQEVKNLTNLGTKNMTSLKEIQNEQHRLLTMYNTEVAPAVFDYLNTSIAERFTANTALIQTTLADLSEHLQRSHIDGNARLTKIMEDCNKNMTKVTRESVESMYTATCQLYSDRNCRLEKIEGLADATQKTVANEIDVSLDSLYKLMKLLMTEMESTKASVVNVCEQQREQRDLFLNDKQLVVTELASVKKRMDDSVEECKEVVDNSTVKPMGIYVNQAEESKTTSINMIKINKNCNENMTDFLENDYANCLKNIVEINNDMKTKCSEFFEEQTELLQTTSLTFPQIDTSLETFRDTTLGHLAANQVLVNTALPAVVELSTGHCDVVTASLSTLTGRYERFFNEEMRMEGHTGETPVKETYATGRYDRPPGRMCRELANVVYSYDKTHEDSFVDEESSALDLSIILDSSINHIQSTNNTSSNSTEDNDERPDENGNSDEENSL